MTQRLDLFALAPDVHRALVRVEQAAKKGLDPVVYELVKLRASQINHCAYCIDMHWKDARAAGETEQRLYLLNAWEEVPHLYTEKERAALALADAVTVLTDGFVPDEVYERAAKHFGEQELARLIGVLTVINAWNRWCVTSRAKAGDYTPGQYEQGA
ncbi:carboxymuconolactone decarboxylase family protein [Streptomyces sp. CMB-StM0423]|uniref:carboxymuconolactone decarboxylase family protein n=1 Tax=Streptomyces sp. CMB-StM0423 TaxID=2059884 RepID=UPI000C713C11|nr:carboxymuconolactone decarboxylase family protein [Streptomyces sp. CMB-StM0423]AUH41042.1 4-carboxymuconolactone decarboxylase [Streptomyces sp. CMB-StM0423]